MKPIVFLIILAPLISFCQIQSPPFVKFEKERIVWYLPASPAYSRQLPSYKPGFVEIILSDQVQTKSASQVSSALENELSIMIKDKLKTEQKHEFLEKFACLILLNYQDVSILSKSFHETAKKLTPDGDDQIRANAMLVTKVFTMYQAMK